MPWILEERSIFLCKLHAWSPNSFWPALLCAALHEVLRLWFYGHVGCFKQAQGWFVEHSELRNNANYMWRLFGDHQQPHLNITMETNPFNVSFDYALSILALSWNARPGSENWRKVKRPFGCSLSSFDKSAYTRPPDRGSRNIQNILIYVSISRFLSTRKWKKCKQGVDTFRQIFQSDFFLRSFDDVHLLSFSLLQNPTFIQIIF